MILDLPSNFFSSMVFHFKFQISNRKLKNLQSEILNLQSEIHLVCHPLSILRNPHSEFRNGISPPSSRCLCYGGCNIDHSATSHGAPLRRPTVCTYLSPGDLLSSPPSNGNRPGPSSPPGWRS